MKDWQSQAHVKWDCKYHVVILPKYRRKVLYGRIRRGVGQILRDLCRQKDIKGTLFGRSFWARGYCVSTVGLDEAEIRRYIRE